MAAEKASGSNQSPDEVHKEQEEVAISLNEYIEAERDLEDDARVILGNSDTSTCTYSQGYVQRQALYSCATCAGDSGVPLGICLACSLECHDGHDLYELYTKRFFRCDCGNSKCETECKLQKEKQDTNSLNKYGQNFKGLYCSCSRPYPDPENENDAEMIQCCMCEDWYHDNHLGLKEEVPSEYEEMICVHCVRRNTFLLNYRSSESSNSVKITNCKEDTDVDITTTTSAATETDQFCSTSNQLSDTSSSLPTTSSADPVSEQAAACMNLTTHPAADCTTLFMLADWRQRLCTCSHCSLHYKSNDIEYLVDVEDPTHVYEQKNINCADSADSYEKGMDALSSLGRVQQIELISGYNDMKSSLSDYLKKFASSDKVVQAEDINQFFEEYGKNKRRRLAVPPPSCS